jgi:hypothetical protein
MDYILSIDHVDTCLPCYVLDHCNDDNEQLIGVAVSRGSRVHHVRAELLGEILAYGDKLPDTITESDIVAAVADCLKGLHPFAAWDSSLDIDDESGESCYAWFRLSWESNDE